MADVPVPALNETYEHDWLKQNRSESLETDDFPEIVKVLNASTMTRTAPEVRRVLVVQPTS